MRRKVFDGLQELYGKMGAADAVAGRLQTATRGVLLMQARGQFSMPSRTQLVNPGKADEDV